VSWRLGDLTGVGVDGERVQVDEGRVATTGHEEADLFQHLRSSNVRKPTFFNILVAVATWLTPRVDGFLTTTKPHLFGLGAGRLKPLSGLGRIGSKGYT
jgi:hypothetical protein